MREWRRDNRDSGIFLSPNPMFAKSRIAITHANATTKKERANHKLSTNAAGHLSSSLRLFSDVSLQLKHISIMGGGHHHYNPEAEPKKDQDLEAIKKAQIPLAWRDTCSHILIDLNKCRRDTWWNPNKCEHERHTYEECEYNAYLQRVEAKVQLNKHGN